MKHAMALQQFVNNWPGRFNLARCNFYAQKVAWASEAEVEAAADIVVQEGGDWPPVVGDLVRAIHRVRTLAGEKAGAHRRKHYPGDVIHGERTFTPEEARFEAARIRKEYPSAFSRPRKKENFATPEGRKSALEESVTRMAVSALDRCARLAPDQPISLMHQHDLF